ncbi:MAG: DUF1987 domain-containing protein [Bacteroidetes bacterium]|nr:MAG: DUF1987 domain-containing protein [Bacteroidota bacterium]TAG85516.1 MAG: DUF1987 domain-containing protein [Bacteroidota bacterium]
MTHLKDLDIEGKRGIYYVPRVFFELNTGKCSIEGESHVEDAYSFYQPIRQWIQTYIADIKGNLFFDIKLTYMNSSSSKSILIILKELKSYQENGGKVEIKWYYRENDTDMLEDAEDLIAESGIDFELIPLDE